MPIFNQFGISNLYFSAENKMCTFFYANNCVVFMDGLSVVALSVVVVVVDISVHLIIDFVVVVDVIVNFGVVIVVVMLKTLLTSESVSPYQ